MMQQEDERNQNYVMANQGFNSASALQIRLNTQTIIDTIEMFLRGWKVINQDTEQGIISQKVKVGKPKANDEGIQSILNFMTSIVNPQVVQGNFTDEQYNNYCADVHEEITTQLVLNCYDWNIKENDLESIIDFIMKIVVPFTSRLIDNKERDSYGNTIRTVESNTIQQKNSAFNLFRRQQPNY